MLTVGNVDQLPLSTHKGINTKGYEQWTPSIAKILAVSAS